MKAKIVSTLAAVLFVSSVASAQGTTRMSTQLRPQKRANVEVFVAPILLKGFGIGLGYAVTPKIETNLFYQQYTLGSDPETGFAPTVKFTTEMKKVGLRADLYPLATVNSGGWYLSGAVTQVQADTKVESSALGTTSASDQKAGVQAYTGYAARGGLLRDAGLAFKIGLGYGVGGGIESSRSTREGTKTEIKDSLLLDLNLALHF